MASGTLNLGPGFWFGHRWRGGLANPHSSLVLSEWKDELSTTTHEHQELLGRDVACGQFDFSPHRSLFFSALLVPCLSKDAAFTSSTKFWTEPF